MGLGVDLGTRDVPICTDKFGNKNEVELAELDTSDVRISTEEVEDENEVELAELELSVLEDILEDILVMLLAKLVEERFQSTGMLLPSSSSSDSGARVQAGPGVLLLDELLRVTDLVCVE
jgi:hypothetical protein